MNADEARKLANKVKSRAGLPQVFEALRKAAEAGAYSLVLTLRELNGTQAEILKAEYGYRVEPAYRESGDPMRSDYQNGWLVKWEL